MDEPQRNDRSLTRTRLFLVIFFGAALLFAALNIYNTLTADVVPTPTPGVTGTTG